MALHFYDRITEIILWAARSLTWNLEYVSLRKAYKRLLEMERRTSPQQRNKEAFYYVILKQTKAIQPLCAGLYASSPTGAPQSTLLWIKDVILAHWHWILELKLTHDLLNEYVD